MQAEAGGLEVRLSGPFESFTALRSRSGLLESQLRDMKAGLKVPAPVRQANVQFLLRKSDDDDALVAMLQKQLGRED